MRIGELARRTGASARSLRYYEHRGLIVSARLDNDYRDFDDAQAERVRAIQFYLGLGLSINQIGGIVNCQGTDAPPPADPETTNRCAALLTLYEAKLTEIDEQIEALSAAKARLRERIALFRAHHGRPAMPGGGPRRRSIGRRHEGGVRPQA